MSTDRRPSAPARIDAAAPAGAPPSTLDPEVLTCLNRLVRDFSSSLELDEVVRNVAEGCKPLVDYDTFAVLLLDELGQQLRFRFALGYPEDVQCNWSFGLGQGIVGTVAKSKQALRVDDVAADSRYIAAAPEIRSELALPLIAKGRTIGVLDVGSLQPRHFTDAHLQLLAIVADHLASGIENARLYESVRDQARMLSLLHEISRELTSILDRERLLEKVAILVKRLIDYQLFSVMLWNEETQLLDHTFSLRFDERFVQKGGFPLGHGVTGTVAALRQPMRIPNVRLNPHYVTCGHGVEVRSELAVPLVFKDRLVGVLDLESTEYNAFRGPHEQILATLASYVAGALENARLYEKVVESEMRLADDLETAREIQRGLLPEVIPQLPGLGVAVAYETARHLGGDFFDFLPYGENRFAFAIGDAAGKGTAAALHGALAIGILRGHVVEHRDAPHAMLQELNRHLGEHRIENRFVALAFGVYDSDTRTLDLANAGFPRPHIVRGGTAREIPIQGVPLGLLPDVRYQSERVQLEPGDRIVLTSDGINEATDDACEEFGSRRLARLLAGVADRSAGEIADAVLQSSEYQAMCGRDEDDRTVLALEVR